MLRTACTRSPTWRPGSTSTRVVGSIIDALHAARRRSSSARPAVPAGDQRGHPDGDREGLPPHADTGALDTAAPAVANDLASTTDTVERRRRSWAPSSAARHLPGRPLPGRGAPVSIVSCDNMAGNGAALAGVIRGFVQASRWSDKEAAARLAFHRCHLPRHGGGPDRARRHRRRTGPPRQPHSACGTTWPLSVSPTGNGSCRIPSSARGHRGNWTGHSSSPMSRPTS